MPPPENPIYLDHNATTPVYPQVAETVARILRDLVGNPASQHHFGQQARRVLEDARQRTAELLGARLGARGDRLLFTAGGTEANNLAVFGLAGEQPGRLVVSAVEHPCVLAAAEHLMERGWRLDSVGVDGQGVVDVASLARLLAAESGAPPALVAVMQANHETGAVQPVAAVAAVCRDRSIPLHVDAVQAAGKMEVRFRDLNAATLAVAAHKFGGPPGVGALLVGPEVALSPRLFGGGQQGGLRPGTESVALAAGMAAALEQSVGARAAEADRLAALQRRFEATLAAAVPGIVVHSQGATRLPTTSSIAFPGLDAQMLLLALDMAGVACSAGPACSSGSTELSPTLWAMGLPRQLVASSLRFSTGWTTTADEVDEAVRRIAAVATQLG